MTALFFRRHRTLPRRRNWSVGITSTTSSGRPDECRTIIVASDSDIFRTTQAIALIPSTSSWPSLLTCRLEEFRCPKAVLSGGVIRLFMYRKCSCAQMKFILSDASAARYHCANVAELSAKRFHQILGIALSIIFTDAILALTRHRRYFVVVHSDQVEGEKNR